MTQLRRAAIVSPIRTGVGKFQGALSSMQAGDLGAIVLKELVKRTKIDPGKIDDVIFAQGYPSGEAPCVARWSALAADLPITVPGYQLDRRCGSGLQSIVDAAMFVQTGAAAHVVGIVFDVGHALDAAGDHNVRSSCLDEHGGVDDRLQARAAAAV
ncbi:MAG TPA: hypothetical protein VGO52_24880, partial [Hyphomonadaceae bacterium]|nr:hypothetical protein [Hyphomonadaceae bacterium]